MQAAEEECGRKRRDGRFNPMQTAEEECGSERKRRERRFDPMRAAEEERGSRLEWRDSTRCGLQKRNAECRVSGEIRC
jgi:hypothetical protein